ncbi:hypothetical protein [Sinosporangium siamense]|uniref:Uncharacterized protein n=1 Tax=Sinosporangium siamense TaxID=1367973 RepID=A0A919V9P7_9ACTN|nr:hypothetical protein [Sinosporangium siamense]GII97440.1 hypothetical protein Ssi02_76710 [Sinosporangium siamense]
MTAGRNLSGPHGFHNITQGGINIGNTIRGDIAHSSPEPPSRALQDARTLLACMTKHAPEVPADAFADGTALHEELSAPTPAPHTLTRLLTRLEDHLRKTPALHEPLNRLKQTLSELHLLN